MFGGLQKEKTMKANKKNFVQLFLSIFFILAMDYSLAHTEFRNDEIRMFEAIGQGNLELFEKLLASGSDPLTATSYAGFKSSSVCEATKLGNEDYFSLIIAQNISLDYLSVNGSFFKSPLTCAIFYGNFPVFQEIVSTGVELNSLLNPDSPSEIYFKYPLNYALKPDRAEFAWDIIRRLEVSDYHEFQIEDVTRFAVKNSLQKKNTEDENLQKIVQWLAEQGVDIKNYEFRK